MQASATKTPKGYVPIIKNGTFCGGRFKTRRLGGRYSERAGAVAAAQKQIDTWAEDRGRWAAKVKTT